MRFQSQLPGHFGEQIRVVLIETEFFEGDAGWRLGGQHRGARVFGEGAERGAGQLHPARIIGALQPGDDAEALGVALKAQKILPLGFESAVPAPLGRLAELVNQSRMASSPAWPNGGLPMSCASRRRRPRRRSPAGRRFAGRGV
jgi:hypothetical protein